MLHVVQSFFCRFAFIIKIRKTDGFPYTFPSCYAGETVHKAKVSLDLTRGRWSPQGELVERVSQSERSVTCDAHRETSIPNTLPFDAMQMLKKVCLTSHETSIEPPSTDCVAKEKVFLFFYKCRKGCSWCHNEFTIEIVINHTAICETMCV